MKLSASGTVSPQFHIVGGAYNPHIEELRALAKERGNLTIHEHVEDMASLMCGMDVCVTAGGSTMYELCAVGLPFVCFSVADNQRPLCEAVSAKIIAPYAGAMDLDAEGTLPQIVSYVLELTADRLLRATRQESQRALIDGHGAENIASALLS